MLPYLHVDDLRLLGLRLHPFGLLVAVAVTLGAALARQRARARGVDLTKLESCIAWMLVVGFVSAHALDEILYRPREVLARPWSLLFVWEGIGSFSGWIGALVGLVAWKRLEWRRVRTFGPWKILGLGVGPFTISKIARRPKTLPILPFADLILSVFPIAWIFGRSGCSLAHDHPGVRATSDTALAIAFPSPNPSVIDGPGEHLRLGPVSVIYGHYPRYDLGTMELFFTIGLALVFVLLWRRRLVTGAYVVITCLVYAPVRFAMEFLRLEETDPRYFALTPAQWMCIGLGGFGVLLLRHVLTLRRSGNGGAALAAVQGPGGPEDAR